MPKMELKGKLALVTGASRGIGREIALRLAKEGVDIVFNYLKAKEAAESLEKEIISLGRKALAVKCDIRDLEAVKKIIEEAKQRFGRLDILINNAGVIRDKALMLMEKDDWQEVIDTDLTGVFNASRAAIVTFLKQKSGDIINISSVSGIVGMSRQVNYSAAKAGVIGFTKALAKEVAGYNIRVNCVAPGYIHTELVDSLKEEYKELLLQKIPLGRFGTCEDVANVVLFLLSHRGSYLTGQIIVVDGGLAMR